MTPINPRTRDNEFFALCLRYEETDYPSLLSPHILNVSLHTPCVLCFGEAEEHHFLYQHTEWRDFIVCVSKFRGKWLGKFFAHTQIN